MVKFPKPKVIRDKDYKDWIKRQRCVDCQKGVDNTWHPLMMHVDPDHIDRSNDRTCLPRCRYHHRIRTDMPRNKWVEKYGDTDKEQITILNEEYEIEKKEC